LGGRKESGFSLTVKGKGEKSVPLYQVGGKKKERNSAHPESGGKKGENLLKKMEKG